MHVVTLGNSVRPLSGQQPPDAPFEFPNMLRIQQQFEAIRVLHPEAAVLEQLEKRQLGLRVQPGQSVAVTVGSRGITNIAPIIRAIVGYLRHLEARPFLVPAMGSHGGGTAEGQQRLIESLGVTAEYVGCEIRSSMETTILGQAQLPRRNETFPIYFDAHAAAADHVLVVGRIKPHTDFVGDVESGLYKMMLIGLGKRQGATLYHRAIHDFSFTEIVRAVGDVVLASGRILGGVAIVENAYDETALIEAVHPDQFFSRERELLIKAKAWLPRLPFADVDLLIIDEIGKEISGTGMDTNVVGRKYLDHQFTDRDLARCKRIFIRRLTAKTNGNGTGIGLAEFTTRHAVEQLNTEATQINCITAGHPTAAMLPVIYDTDRAAITAALSTIGLTPPERARVIQIRDTLHLQEVLVSAAYQEQLRDRADLKLRSPATAMAFDSAGQLMDVG